VLTMTMHERALLWLREPLVHFLIAGAAVFALLSGRAPDPGERRIVVDEAVVGRLVDRWTQSYRRPPSAEEIDGLIRDHVREEVYYREALRLGLDRDDEVVRKRMRNKLAATNTAQAEASVPTDAELQALLDRDPARYAAETRYDLTQLYLGADSPAARAAATRQLARLNAGAAAATIGQPLPLPAQFKAAVSSDLAAQFGDEFAEALVTLPAGKWSGPIASGLGLHLVRVEQRRTATPPKLATVRQRAENDWRSAKIRAAEEQALQTMLDGYDVVIRQPK